MIAIQIASICAAWGAFPAVAQSLDTPSESESESAPAPERVSPTLPAPPQDFTFKRVRPPEPGATRRITVQIVPQPDPPPLPAVADIPEPDAPSQPFSEPVEVSGFYQALGTGRVAAGPSRLLEAMEWFDTADPAPAAPPLSHMASLAEQYGRDMLAASLGTQVSPALALAVAWTESSGRASVTSAQGAQGLMQLIPATAARFEVEDPFNAQQNLRGGIAYLDWLLNRFGGDPVLALAGYNAGERAVERAQDGAGGVPDYPETREYVVKVLSAWRVARGLCLTPPTLASDGCVFAPIAAN
ncbi:MAG: lytic transglycosylase domain-containing protein [Dinoroseobacter sp.]|nr:lytic transglycosylase domain-containing protein [Dinoroseobacter sp.]